MEADGRRFTPILKRDELIFAMWTRHPALIGPVNNFEVLIPTHMSGLTFKAETLISACFNRMTAW